MWIIIDLVLIVLMNVFALVHLYRRTTSADRRHRVKWTLVIVLLPFFGAIGYFFSVLEGAIQQRGTPGRRDELAPFLRSFKNDR